MKNRLMVLALAALFAACGSGMKLNKSSYAEIADKGTKTLRDQYVFSFDKKSGNYIEIVEVKLINKVANWEESVPFQVTDKDGKQTILDVKGRDSFAVVATRPKGENSQLASSAVIVYRAESGGDKKYYTVKSIGN